MTNINVNYVYTDDGLKLQGIHYVPEKLETCVLFIHGMSGNWIENQFGHIWGKILSEAGFGFIYSHNRGYFHINDIGTNRPKIDGGYESVRCGVTYERFKDCILDIDAWILEAKKLGYKKIILTGHSLGTNKVIHYCSNRSHEDISGIILLSPPDMVANGSLNGKSEVYDRQISEAKENIRNGFPRKLLTDPLWDWYTLSSQTFLDLFEGNGPADNLPILRCPEEFPELSTISKPILVVMGEFDDIVVRSLSEDMGVIEKKATKCPKFVGKIIPKANHCYVGQEVVTANAILDWLLNL